MKSEFDITDWATIGAAFENTSRKFSRIRGCYRGQANSAWGLVAHVFRTERSRNLETTFLRYFMSQAETRHPRCPSPDDLMGWLVLARHYGLPTRLLDWSASPLVALYFATGIDPKQPDADGSLFALQQSYLNRHSMGGIGLIDHSHSDVTQLAASAFNVDAGIAVPTTTAPGISVMALGTREIDLRVLAQQGSFTIHADGQDLCELHAKASIALEGSSYAAPEYLLRYNVPADRKQTIRNILRDLGVSKRELFPDLASLAESLMEENYPPVPELSVSVPGPGREEDTPENAS